jgi:hypothetical protein
MIFFSSTNGEVVSGHYGETHLVQQDHQTVTEVQADCDELTHCCAILGRQLPPNRVYTFVGDNAKEIVKNWY